MTCECGSYMMIGDVETVYCPNPDCQYLGKAFKYPTVEVEEI